MRTSYWAIAVMIVLLSARPSPAAEPISVLLEKGIYTEETAGDLAGAIKIYEQIVSETASNSQYAAEAALRIGMCHLRKGDKAKAVTALENVVSNFASQTGIVDKAKAQLIELNWRPLELLPAPWTDGEIVHYNIRQHSGAPGGAQKEMVKADKLGGKDVWRIETLARNTDPDYRHYACVVADRDSMFPSSSHYEQGEYGSFNVTYERGKILAKGKVHGTPLTRNINTDYPVYDANQLFHLLRRLPLTNGYTQKFSTYYVQGEQNGWIALEVKGVEKITVPAGTFDCYRVEYSASGFGCCFTAWISADDRRYLVKHSYIRSEDTFLELAAVTHEPDRQFSKDGKPDFAYVDAAFAATPPLSLNPAPWADGEALTYFTYNRNGELLGIEENLVKADRRDGRDVWVFERIGLEAGPSYPERAQYHRAVAEADDLMPIEGYYNRGIHGTDMLSYTGGTVEITTESNGISSARTLPLDKPFYDALEINSVIRRLPLAVGYSQRIPALLSAGKEVYTDIRVTARETITVPAGTFQCLVLPMNVTGWGQGGLYVSDDEHRYVVKAFWPLITMELAKVSVDPARTFLTNGVPDFEPLVKAFKERQAGKGGVTSEPLTIGPAPWQDGEEMRLNLKTAAGLEIGTMIWSAHSDISSGRPAWRIEQRLFVTANNSEQFTRVLAKKDTFAPIQGLTVNQLGWFDAAYGDRQVELKTSADGGASVKKITTGGIVYDNEQALYLIRRLPLAVGYKASFPIFPVVGGKSVECRIEVTGKDKLTVPAGTFDCLKVELSVWDQNVLGLQHQLWFSDDDRRLLVRYDSGQAVMELTPETWADAGGANLYTDKALGISMKLPKDWVAYNNPTPGAYKAHIQLLPPELKLWASLIAVPRTSSLAASIRAVAENDITTLKGFFKNYSVRPDSWKSETGAGVETTRFIADYEEPNGEPKVEYRIYILSQTTIYWFVFRVDKLDFEKAKSELDAIVSSFMTTDGQSAASESDALKQARVDLQVRKERLDQVEKMTEAELANASGFIVAEPIIASIRKQLGEVKVEIESALAGATNESDTQVKALEARRATLEKQLHDALEGLKNGLQADYEVARKKYEALLNETRSESNSETTAESATRKTDKIDYPFVDDPAVLGRWVSVDYVKEIGDFTPDVKSWKDNMFLKELTFEKGGTTTAAWTWTKGLLLHAGDRTASKYVIKTIGTNDYLFFEWKSGDYTLRGMKPWYYVLARAP